MDMMEIRRRVLMGRKAEQWDNVYTKTYGAQSWLLDVIEGQVLTVKWESPSENINLNGWVLNGNGCCESIRQIKNVGVNGEKILTVTASGKIRIGGYSNSGTFGLSTGSIIYIRVN